MRQRAAASTLVVSCGDPWPAGFLALYADRYGDMVRLARLLIGRSDAAEDIVQDCCLRLVARWGRVDQPEAYLRRSVVNASRSWLRRHLRLHPLEVLRPVDDPPVRDRLPADVGEVWDALSRLSHRRRAAVVLRYYEDLDDIQIAELLGCRPATVRSLVHRAQQQLKEVLG